MKIVYIIPRFEKSGPINQLYDLVSGIRRLTKKIDMEILTLYPEKAESGRERFVKLGLKCSSLKINRKNSWIAIWRKLNAVIARKKPDIIHSMTLPGDLAAAGIKKRTGAVKCSTVHCNIYINYKYRFKNAWRIYVFLHEACLRKMNLVAVCSYSLAKVYKNLYAVPIQNGICLDKYCIPDEESLIKQKSLLGLSESKKIVAVAGSLDANKNPLFIIASLMPLVTNGLIQLVFLGDGELHAECKKMTHGKDIVLKGKVDNLEQFLACADILVSASSTEGMPLAVLEAGICGCRLILSDIPAHREVTMYGEGVRVSFFRKDEPKELEQRVKEALFETYDRKAAAGYFSKYFSRNRMCRNYIEIYRKLFNLKW